ncbi:hypothetical protein AQS70_11725 [Pseudomonas endophytica]|uniref:DUF1269 domain-containing protein n=1 Tax=Pseudomonas endophytica TaxID=1563157 RepID=A0A0N8VSF4_9PSED|nr:DUF1269 domain-containing protein [Pseudomonas endophytica]KQB53172.1 hypothetical protein AQS70_11725 [Pseudomonas endophytica]
MSDLIVVGFPDSGTADRALSELVALSKEYLVELDDAVIVVRNAEGKIHIKQSVNLTAIGATSGLVTGGLWGALVGLLFLNPLAGFAIGGALGAGAGALSGSLSDFGIDDTFIKNLSDTIPNNSSALFVLLRKYQPEKVLEELQKEGFEGKVLRTSLSPEQEQKLQEALSHHVQPQPAA